MGETKVTEKDKKDAVQAVNEIRKLVEEHGGTVKELQGEAKTRFEKLDETLKSYDDKNEQIMKELAEEKSARIEDKEKFDNLEKVVSRQSQDPQTKESYKASPEYLALKNYIKDGKDGLSLDEKQLLATDTNGRGGYLLGGPMVVDLLRQVEELSPVRQEARVRNIGNTKAINIPVRTSIPKAKYEGERETAEKQTSTYRSETMVAHRHHVIVPVTRDLLNFADVNVENEMTIDATEGFAVSEGDLFLTGTGDKQPEGVLVNSDIAVTPSGTALTIGLTETITLFGELKVGYEPVYFWNRKTLVHLRTIRTDSGAGAGTGNYLWREGAEGQPSTLNGIPYRIFQAMPDFDTANAKAVGLGDFARGYTIFDSMMIELLRDEVTQADEAIINMHWFRYNTGQVVIPEAFKLISVTP